MAIKLPVWPTERRSLTITLGTTVGYARSLICRILNVALAHIATVGKAMSSSEEVAYPILRKHDVDYVLVIFGGLLGYSGDDINKFLWMVRIAQGVWPDEIQEPNYFTPQGEYRIDERASPTMKNSLMYKMSFYRYDLLILRVTRTHIGTDLPSSLAEVKPSIESGNKTFLKSVRRWTFLVCNLSYLSAMSSN